MKKVLLEGSLAYDVILRFHGKFQASLQPELISTAFYCTEKVLRFGGCAGNIAYGLHHCGVEFEVFSQLGSNDSGKYLNRLAKWTKNLSNIDIVQDADSASAYICSDNSGQQITFFYPGPDESSGKSGFSFDEPSNYSLAVVAPNSIGLMFQALHFAIDSKIPLFFDPGQQLPFFLDNGLILKYLPNVDVLFLNESELELLLGAVGVTEGALAKLVKTLVVTRGANSTILYVNSGNSKHEIPIEEVEVVDPTGCGDAFRVGFISKVLNGCTYLEATIYANKLGAACVSTSGAQDYKI